METIRGAHLLHTCKQGAIMRLFDDGTAVVCHPDDEPYLLNADGSVERLIPSDPRRKIFVWQDGWIVS